MRCKLNRVVLILLILILTFLHHEWRWVTHSYFGTTKQGENLCFIWIASVFPQILLTASAPAAEPAALLRSSGNAAGNLTLFSIPIYSVYGFDTSCLKLSNAAFSVPLWSLVQEIFVVETASLKGLSHLVQSCLLYRSCMSKDSARSTGHDDHFFPNKILRSLQEINA